MVLHTKAGSATEEQNLKTQLIPFIIANYSSFPDISRFKYKHWNRTLIKSIHIFCPFIPDIMLKWEIFELCYM